MKYISLIVICILTIFAACRSSARFSSTNTTNQEHTRNEESSKNASALNSFIRQWLHTPYKYGGMSKSGVDCSGFSSIVMKDFYQITIPRTAQNQYDAGERIRDGWRKPGDLVFFKNVRGRGIDHVGIYLGNNQFAHSSTRDGVIISNLDEDYYHIRYVGTCRFSK